MPRRPKLPKAVLNRASRSEFHLTLEKYANTAPAHEGAIDPRVDESRDESRRRLQLRNEAGLTNPEFIEVSNRTPRQYHVRDRDNMTRGILNYIPSWQNQLKFNANQKKPRIVDIGADRTEDRASLYVPHPTSLMPEILDTDRRNLKIGPTLRALAAVRKQFPTLKELKVNVEYLEPSPAYLRQRKIAAGYNTPPLIPDRKYFTRIIKLKNKGNK
jgi:hypothetical protein